MQLGLSICTKVSSQPCTTKRVYQGTCNYHIIDLISVILVMFHHYKENVLLLVILVVNAAFTIFKNASFKIYSLI